MLLIPALLVLPAAAADTPPQPSAKEWWRQGLSAARKGTADSALYCMKKSFAGGISDDSLYYLWAEIFLYRGVLDTALALNYSIPAAAGSSLFKKAVEQRYTIFKTLGWKKEAKAFLDSLDLKPPGWWHRFLPECTVYLSGGGYYENSAADKNYPYARHSDSTETIVNGNGIASLLAGWRLPVGNTQGIRFGAKLRYAGSRFSVASSTAHLNDSSDASFGGYLRYSFFSDRLVAGYTFSRKRDFLDIKTYLHQLFLQYAFLMKRWLGFVEAGYHYESPINEHFYYLMSFLDREIGRKQSVSFTLFLSGMSAEPLQLTNEVPIIYANDGVGYEDPLHTTRLNALNPNYDTLQSKHVIVQNYWNIHPQIRWERRFNKRLSAGTGLGYTLTAYRNDYEWADFKYSFEEIPEVISSGTHLLAYDDRTGDYYWVQGIGLLGRTNLDSVPISIYRQRRVDQSISLNLFFKSSLGKYGHVMLDVTGRRNFSSLTKSAPVDIQRWYGETMLTWFFRFKPDYGP